jgi:hypothetical protein
VRAGVLAAVAGALLLSCWVAANGAVFSQHAMDVCVQNDFALEALCWYVPEFSALLRPFVVPRALSRRELAMLAYFASVALLLAIPLAQASLHALSRRRALAASATGALILGGKVRSGLTAAS